MKKIMMGIWFVYFLIGTAVFAQDISKNVNSINAPELTVAPTIDGKLDDPAWADVPSMIVNGTGDSPAATDPGDLDITMKVAWDKETNALYFAFDIKDNVFVNILARGASSGGDGWQNERMELILNGLNTGSASDGENSQFHTQYTFDLPNTIDNAPLGLGDVPVSTQFITVPVLEAIDGSIIPNTWPYNLNDKYVQSAAQIKVTSANATAWAEAPVEWTWEFKIVVFDEMYNNSTLSFDLSDQANIDNGFLAFFEDPTNVIHLLKANDVIGFSPQQNDSDAYEFPPTRNHQQNTTNRASNWNSSTELTGLVLLLPKASVSDWSLQ